ncbi:MAG: hypothetical protein KGJ77_10820, partial [Acidobacteriota bacterium]|nr:hypothetical protein [Acidobacteriota bacterium]
DEDCGGERLAAELDALLAGPSRLAAMAEAAAALGRPDALEAVTAVVEAHARAATGRDAPPVAGPSAREAS